MRLTSEQIKIISSSGDLRIDAVAGSGKTSTLIEYAKKCFSGSKILYLAFNRTVKQEARSRFRSENIFNVQVETAHSLAYKKVVSGGQYRLKNSAYKSHELVDILKINSCAGKHSEYVLASHVEKFFSYFCNSDKRRLSELNYLDVVFCPRAKSFVSRFYNEIEVLTLELLLKMNRFQIEIVHDFYLKKFHLLEPKLNFDYIFFDEGQDASMAMLDVFLKQSSRKLIVGDLHQQIYGWRHAVNSLNVVDFKALPLSVSFRFHQQIADLAMAILAWKKNLNSSHRAVSIKGRGKLDGVIATKAVIARTNLGLLLSAIDFVSTDLSVGKKIYFEGGLSSYTYAEEGASLHDVLNLYNKKHRLIKDPLLKNMRDIDELGRYIEKSGDLDLAMMLKIVRKYGNQVYKLIEMLKASHVADGEKHLAEMFFSTVHRCKGLEYDSVSLVGDFVDQVKIEKAKQASGVSDYDLEKLNEEINLLYVAVTRAKYFLEIPIRLVPKDFARDMSNIIVIGEKVEDG